MGKREMHGGFCWGKLNQGSPLENLGIVEEIIKRMFKKQNEKVLIVFFWPRIRTSGDLL
jgi:hypothetical protein